jgi:hypothetical protein
MNRFDFTDYTNIRALVDATSRAVNDRHSDLRRAREEYKADPSSKSFMLLRANQYDESLVLSYVMQAESYLLRADSEELCATSPYHTARVAEHRACANTLSARADEYRADAEASHTKWTENTA